MKFLIAIVLIISDSSFAKSLNKEEWLMQAKSRCFPASSTEAIVTQDDFHWNMTADEMRAKFSQIYDSGKRLKDRAYWDAKSGFVMPLERGSTIKIVRINSDFLWHIKLHLEKALQLEYVSHIFFPDMGHSHLLLPTQDFTEQISEIPIQQIETIYERLFSHPRLKVLYHTAEQLKMMDDNHNLLPDPNILWRYFTRNLVITNNDRAEIEIYKNLNANFNTVNNQQTPGYTWWSAGFNLSSSVKACFSYKSKEQELFFDLSLKDI